MDDTHRRFVVIGDDDGICVRGLTHYAYTRCRRSLIDRICAHIDHPFFYAMSKLVSNTISPIFVARIKN